MSTPPINSNPQILMAPTLPAAKKEPESKPKPSANDEPGKQAPSRFGNRETFTGFINQFRMDLKPQQDGDPESVQGGLTQQPLRLVNQTANRAFNLRNLI